MELFERPQDENMLPFGGVAKCFGKIFTDELCRSYFEELEGSIEWRHDEVMMFGKCITTARRVAWVADEGLSYAYSGRSKQPAGWTELLLGLRGKCQVMTGAMYNSCLLNFYHSGGEGMGWHSDDEKSIVPGSSIACLSFGAERKFSFRHKDTREGVSLLLENGSLLEMKGAIQENWQHQLPKSKRVLGPRISLTFRLMR